MKAFIVTAFAMYSLASLVFTVIAANDAWGRRAWMTPVPFFLGLAMTAISLWGLAVSSSSNL